MRVTNQCQTAHDISIGEVFALRVMNYNFCDGDIVVLDLCLTRRPASADRTARAANFRRDLEAT